MNASFKNPAPRGAGFITVFALIALLFSAFTFAATPALAQDDMPKLGIEPAGNDEIFFSEKLKPGATRELTVELSNSGKSGIEVLTYAADVYSLVNGGFGVKLAGEPATGTTTWLDYPVQKMELPGGEGRVVTFTVSVPRDATPGEYVTSLVIQNAEPIKGTGNLTVNQVLRQAIAVAITVPGERQPAIELGAVTYNDNPLVDSVLIEVRNTGNVHVKPAGTVHIVDASGALALDARITMDSVYAGTSTVLEIGLADSFTTGEYRATIDLTDAETAATASVSDQRFDVVDTARASTALRIDRFEVSPVRASADGPVQVADVTVAIENPGAQVEGTQVLLHVERDGQFVEDYPLTVDAAIEFGASEIRQRYLPLTGWLPGSYHFTVRIVATDPATGEATVLAALETPVVVIIE